MFRSRCDHRKQRARDDAIMHLFAAIIDQARSDISDAVDQVTSAASTTASGTPAPNAPDSPSAAGDVPAEPPADTTGAAPPADTTGATDTTGAADAGATLTGGPAPDTV